MNQSIKGDNNTQNYIAEFKSNLNDISSLIALVIPKIAKITTSSEMPESDTVAYELEAKVTYNNISTFKEILDEYGQFGPQIDLIYEEYDNETPGFINSALRYFKTKYLLQKQNLCSLSPDQPPLEVIRENSDKILRNVFEEFKAELQLSNNLKISIEQLDACALAITCHAFFQCKILEKPNK